MRITPELLLKLAGDLVAQRIRSEKDLIAVYLQGSLLQEHPVLAGTTDIDLFFIHADATEDRREILRITDDIHYDIAHHSRRMYSRAKDLRLHPWLGPGLGQCKILYDPQHFLDFTQASVRDQLYRPDMILARSRPLAEAARNAWLGFQGDGLEADPQGIISLLKAMEDAVNAVACVSGLPLTERRLLMDFPARASAVNHPGMFAGLLGLLGAPRIDAAALRGWLPEWEAAYRAAAQLQIEPRLHTHRLNYYRKSIEHLLEADRYQLGLWPLWRTWTHATALLPKDAPHLGAWRQAGESLGLQGEALSERVVALDAFLDQVEETLDAWANAAGTR
jgi:hypothetical protein